MHHGWSAELVGKLAIKSQEEFMMQQTPLDAHLFSRGFEIADDWFRITAKKPLIAWLGTLTGDLAGIAWITNPNKDQHNTSGTSIFSAKVYEGYRQQGVGTILGAEVHRRYDEVSCASTQFTVRTNNNAAFSLGIKFGYKLDDEKGSTQGQITLVRKG